MDWRGRRSLKLLALAGALVGAWLAFPVLRGLAWIHFRGAPPESYVVPVPGVRVSELEPGFGSPRPLGAHEGIDIAAPVGTPVLAAADGVIIRNRPSSIGGNVLWIQGSARQLYYYAHMQELAPGLRRGAAVGAGDRIGSVGNTGNAANTPPHLHFAIYRVTSDLLPLRYRAMDPYPVLVASGRSVEEPPPQLASAPREPPPDLGPPFDPEEFLSLAASEVVAQAEAATGRLASVLRSIDPFLGVRADADVRRVPRVYGIPGRIRRSAVALRERAASDFERPLAELSPELRALGRRLHQHSRRLEALLTWYETCAPRERSVFLNALETVALDSARDPDGVDPAGPRADYFFFAGRGADLVPADGGWLAVVGQDLWQSGAPEVSLVGPDAESIASFEPYRLGEGDAVAVWVARRVLAARGGSCLSLRLTPRPRREAAEAGELFLPLCIPGSYESGYRLATYLSYQLPTATRTLETDEIFFSNSSCDDRKEVSRTLEWQLEPDGRLLDTGQFELYSVHDSSIDCVIDANRVTCSGWLGPARCDGEGRVDTEWHHIFSPTEEYPDREVHRSAALAPFVAADSPTTRTCAEIRRNEQSEETSMWFDLFVQNADQQENFFSSPHEVAKDSMVSSYEQGSHRIEAELDPAAAPGTASICVTIRSPECPSLGEG
ncbi:MAG: M23 family metallopeptidase [Myxococcota bacterium]